MGNHRRENAILISDYFSAPFLIHLSSVRSGSVELCRDTQRDTEDVRFCAARPRISGRVNLHVKD